MRLKRYRHNSVRGALAQARNELGPGALVLSTRLVPARGPRGWLGGRVVEVTAAVDPAAPAVSGNRPEDAHAGAAMPTPGRSPAEERARVDDSLVARLCAAGLDRAVAQEAAGKLSRFRRRNASLVTLRHAVAETLGKVAAGQEALAPIEVFVGPPGAGKTTTIAKLAAQERVRRGARLTLVAADGFRVGAVEQLRLFADILGTPFHIARTPAELERVLRDATAGLLVDTAGRSPQDDEASQLFDVFAGHPGVRTHLVMPAVSSTREIARALDRFRDADPARLVLTKVDETDSVAPLVGLLRDRNLRVSYLGTGQRVPEDLVQATASALAARVLADGPEGVRSDAC